ncbi:transcriptional regulator with XRE-family HTH domain [Kitasatospora sp. MAP12-15]|uniref:helix-turn-helix domain-containing protein n=1 Tax=unclassified Kitasatospora TaxID=2633591 RepID=UPI00247363F0|nr:helix-turn-helix transcriptional regulator [Kitasatospora sp. MAP12-44]MDH6113980.1 transcriptional regulator with XRE-family HTH domain [Kitasatospora sp. MAP12-44]
MRRTEVDPASSPLAAFAVQLRRSREAKGLSQVAFGKLICFSDSWVSCVERATRVPTHSFAVSADRVLETGGTLELMWWNLKHSGLIEGFPEYMSKEAEATVIRLVEFRMIPGLLQTTEYAQAWEAGNIRRGSATQTQVDDRVSILAARQRQLDREPAPILHAVVDEGCLLRPIGGCAVMARQLRHLENLAQLANVIIQVSPYSLAADHPFTHPMVLLTMSNRAMVGYMETVKRGYLERDAEEVGTWDRDYDRLQIEALPQAASLSMIREVRKELESHAG